MPSEFRREVSTSMAFLNLVFLAILASGPFTLIAAILFPAWRWSFRKAERRTLKSFAAACSSSAVVLVEVSLLVPETLGTVR